MAFDWNGLEDFLTAEIESAVRSAARDASGTPLTRATITDFYARNMLVLWPTIVVIGAGQWQFEANQSADEWASRVTAHAGSWGRRWSTVIDEFFDHVVASCRRAADALLDDGSVDSGFVVIATAPDRALITRCLTPAQLASGFPLIHRRNNAIHAMSQLPVEQRLTQLINGLVPERSESALSAADCAQLLIQMGERAAIVAAETLASGMESTALLSQIIDDVGSASTAVVSHLMRILHDTRIETTVRERVACSLAWLGQLDAVCAFVADLTDDALCAAFAVPYISAAKNGPLNYRPLEAALAAVPHLHDRLFAQLSSTHMYPIDSEDLCTAVSGLSSSWPVVRRHAAIVILSTHV